VPVGLLVGYETQPSRGAHLPSYRPDRLTVLLKIGTAAQLSPSRPSQRELTEVGAFAAVLLFLATVGSSPPLGEVRPQSWSPGRTANPTWFIHASAANRSGRGPTFRTAPRGATSRWVEQRDWFHLLGSMW